jgi:hypothetical protein
VVELPKPPWYRRFGVVFLAANLVVAAVLAQAGRLLPDGPEPATILPTSTRARLEPGVLWQR